jgi:hypothetical protein
VAATTRQVLTARCGARSLQNAVKNAVSAGTGPGSARESSAQASELPEHQHRGYRADVTDDLAPPAAHEPSPDPIRPGLVIDKPADRALLGKQTRSSTQRS